MRMERLLAATTSVEASRFRYLFGPRAVALFGVSLAAAVLWLTQQPFVFPLDDTYITIHNARVLLSGHDPNYGVSALIGATSPIHLAAVAAVLTTFPPVLGCYLIAVAGSGAYILGLLELVERSVASPIRRALLFLVGLGTGYTSYHLLNGLETPWAMAGVTWAIVLAREQPSHKLASLCGLLPFIRPELVILSVLLMVRQAWMRRDLRASAIDLAIAAICAIPWLCWSYVETGSFVANTAGAKMSFFAESGLPLATKLGWTLLNVANGLGIASLAVFILPRRDSLGTALWMFAGIVLGAFALLFPGGLVHNLYRYQFTLLPVCVYALAQGQAMNKGTLLLAVSAALGAINLVHGVATTIAARPVNVDGLAAGTWAQSHLPPNSRILVHDAGEFAFASTLAAVDMVGLKRAASVAAHRKYTLPSNRQERWRAIDEIARTSRADYAVILNDRYWRTIADDLRRGGWTLVLVRSAGTTVGYNIYRLIRPDNGSE